MDVITVDVITVWVLQKQRRRVAVGQLWVRYKSITLYRGRNGLMGGGHCNIYCDVFCDAT